MEYHTVDKFNRGIGHTHHLKTDEDIDNLKERVKNIEEIGSLYYVTKNYFSTKGRRIVSVSKAIDKFDVVVKVQLDEAIEKIGKKLDKHIKAFETFKTSMAAAAAKPKPTV